MDSIGHAGVDQVALAGELELRFLRGEECGNFSGWNVLKTVEQQIIAVVEDYVVLERILKDGFQVDDAVQRKRVSGIDAQKLAAGQGGTVDLASDNGENGRLFRSGIDITPHGRATAPTEQYFGANNQGVLHVHGEILKCILILNDIQKIVFQIDTRVGIAAFPQKNVLIAIIKIIQSGIVGEVAKLVGGGDKGLTHKFRGVVQLRFPELAGALVYADERNRHGQR